LSLHIILLISLTLSQSTHICACAAVRVFEQNGSRT
jgi:hypothetical protein